MEEKVKEEIQEILLNEKEEGITLGQIMVEMVQEEKEDQEILIQVELDCLLLKVIWTISVTKEL